MLPSPTSKADFAVLDKCIWKRFAIYFLFEEIAMKQITKNIISFLLSITMLFTLASPAFAVVRSAQIQESQRENWIVVSKADGSVYLENDITGEIIVSAFRIDENGHEQPVDLIDYANALNTLSIMPAIAATNTQDDVMPQKQTAVIYSYKETTSYKGIGTGIKVTPDVVGPATITYGESVSVSEQFGGGITITAEMKKKITAEVNFTWNVELSSSANFTVSKDIISGRTGYVEFRPYLNVTKGTLTKKVIHSPEGLVVSSTDYDAWGQCPIMLSSGFADGIYDVRYK